MPTCPVCDGASAEIRSVSPREAALHFVLPQEDAGRFDRLVAHIGHLWGGGSVTLRRCVACGLGFADPLVGGDAEFYSLAFNRRGGYPRDKWEYTRTMQALQNVNLDHVIEVGAGPGHFLSKIRGRVGKATAYEYDEKSIDALKALGVKAIQGDLHTGQVPEPADAIFYFQVLEHLSDPVSVLKVAAKALKPGGRLFIAVPHGAAIQFQEDSGSLLDMPPNHITNWTHRAIELAGEKAGLSLVESDEEPFLISEHIKKDVMFSYLRAAQRENTLASRVRATRNRPLMAATMIAMAPRRVGWWLKAAASPKKATLWAQLRRLPA